MGAFCDFLELTELETATKPTTPDATSAASGANSMSSPSEILFWYPNLIGYARVVLAIISFCLYENPYIFFWCYLISFTLDAADGHVARLFNQLALWRCARYGDGSLRNSMLGRDPFPSLLSLPPHLYATDHSLYFKSLVARSILL